ncbi:MAG: glutathione S-transferase family protein [Pseudooceanicola sp.]
MYELIGNAQTRTFRVMWMLEELEQDFTWRPALPHSEAVSEHSILGKVPVLLVDGEPLTDSAAILTFLADKHGKFTFPAGSVDRARQDGLTHQILDELDAVIWTAARHSFVLPKDMRVPEIKPPLQAEFTRNTAKLSNRLKGPFLMGDQMTVPDILSTHCLNWAVAAKFPAVEGALAEHADRMRARPAYQRAMERAQSAS